MGITEDIIDNKMYLFTYGMNTSSHIMKRHNRCIPVGPAVLEGYHLVFQYHASIESGGEMHGVLWEINDETLACIDVQEGYPEYYDRFEVPVLLGDSKYTAIVYQMNKERVSPPLHIMGAYPTPQYLAHIYDGYVEFNLPLTQILKALIASPQPHPVKE